MMKTLRKSIYENDTRYQSQENIRFILSKRLQREIHSNQSNYFTKHKGKRYHKISMNEESLSVSSTKSKQFRDGELNLPIIANKTPIKNSRKSLLKTNLGNRTNALIHLNKQVIKKYKVRAKEDEQKLNCIYLTHEGNRIKNEDRISLEDFTVNHISYQYAAVFDGHGGHLTSNYLANNLFGLIKSHLTEGKQPLEAMRLSLLKVEESLRKNSRIAHKSGSCALVCLIANDKCWVANIGDSRLISIDKTKNIAQVTNDHKPQCESERRRIEYNGGEVYRNPPTEESISQDRPIPYRVYPGKLSVSRTIGDIAIKKPNPHIVIADPEMFTISITNLKNLLLISDGIYERMNNQQIGSYFLTHKLEDGLNNLFQDLLRRGSEDNRSMIAIRFK